MKSLYSWRRLARSLGDRLSFQAPLKDFTTFGLGGPALILARPEKSSELKAAISLAREEGRPTLLLGGGSNLLFSDAGFNGLVVKLGGGFAAVEAAGPRSILAGAAASSAALLSGALSRELSGLEGLAGLPGTVGGALAGNAGAGDRPVGTATAKVFILGEDGEARAFGAQELNFSYRRLAGLPEGAVILGAEFYLTPRPAGEIKARVRELTKNRKLSQPLDARSAGCVFKNPPGLSAGRLIEECGLKGEKIGGARISERHANFIVAEDGATAEDVLKLVERARRETFKRLGTVLELEIKAIGPDGEAAA